MNWIPKTRDPRTQPGELWWPERFGRTEIEDLKRSLGAYGVAGQLQQRPSPAAGGIFRRHWWRYWQPAGVHLGPVPVKQPDNTIRYVEAIPLPPLDEEIQSWDMAFKDLEESDFVVGQNWGRAAANKFLLDQVRGRLDFPRTLDAVRNFSAIHPTPAKLVEDKANGTAVIAMLQSEIPGIIGVNPEGGKEARAWAVSPQVEAGNVYLPHPSLAPWVTAFIEECAGFPMAANDDQVDCTTQALLRLTKSAASLLLPEFRAHHREGEPPEACHVIGDDQLEPWWPRWVSIGVLPGAVRRCTGIATCRMARSRSIGST